jgi:hypothetical protein
MKITLYLKTHNKTGLKYLGKTIQDPYTYLGSGKRWQNHLKKHGNDVTTQILLETNDPKEIIEWGIHYSNLWNVVKDQSFANIRPETGDGGDMSMCDAYHKGIKMRDTKGSKNSMYGRSAIVEQNIRWYNNGVKNVYVPEGTQPKGFKPGRIITYKKPHKAKTKSLIGKANSRSCVSPKGEVFESRKEAAKKYGVSAPAIGGLIARGVSGWRWATQSA